MPYIYIITETFFNNGNLAYSLTKKEAYENKSMAELAIADFREKFVSSLEQNGYSSREIEIEYDRDTVYISWKGGKGHFEGINGNLTMKYDIEQHDII